MGFDTLRSLIPGIPPNVGLGTSIGNDLPEQGGITGQLGKDGKSGNSPLGDDATLAKLAIQVIQQSTAQRSGDVVSRPQVIMPQPRIPQQMPMSEGTPAGNVNATTRGGQRRNDFNNLMQSVGNIVKTGINKKRQENERDIMHDLAVIQSAASNPDDPHNKAILDKMAQDPKVVKRLQKSLGYNPLSGEAPTEEQQALIKFGAQSQAKNAQQVMRTGEQTQGGNQLQPTGAPTGGGAMQNLLSRMPNTNQINPVVAMQAELIKAGILPKNDMTPKALLSFVQEAMKDSTKREDIKARAEATNNRTLMNLYQSLTKADAYLKRGGAHDASQEKIAKGHDDARRYAADKSAESAKYRSDRSGSGRDQTFNNLKIAANAYDQDIKNLDVQIAAAKNKGDDKAYAALKRQQDQKKALKSSIEQAMRDRLGMDKPSGVDELEQSDDPTEKDMDSGDFVFGSSEEPR